MQQPSNTSASAMPSGSMTETVNTPSSDEMSQKTTNTPATLEEAMAKLASLERKYTNKVEEAQRHYSKLSKFEADEKAAQEAQMTEQERLQKQYSELEAQHSTYKQQVQDRLIRYAVERQAEKLGIIDPDAAYRLLNKEELEFDVAGEPTNAEELLSKLVTNKPYLLSQQNAQTQTPTTKAGVPYLPVMNPGRSQIASPEQSRMPRLTDGNLFKQ